MMPPVISALLDFVMALFRSRRSLHLEHLALRHQLAVDQRAQPRLLLDSRGDECSGPTATLRHRLESV